MKNIKIIGTISLAILTMSCSTSKEKVKTPIYEKCVASSNGVKIRSMPDQKATQLGSLKSGDRIQIYSLSKNSDKIGEVTSPWAQIYYNGTEGWVYAGFLKDNCPKDSSPYKGILSYNNYSSPIFDFKSADKKYRLGSVYKSSDCPDDDSIDKCISNCSYEAGGADCKFLSVDIKNDYIIFKIEAYRSEKFDKHINGIYTCQAINGENLQGETVFCKKN
jgi:hypothetical protein